jgi:hypothetical protein
MSETKQFETIEIIIPVYNEEAGIFHYNVKINLKGVL